ncbi:TonB-dependent receptor domain-containing protein [Roseococcus sp. SYP-B2431]|uniref:TonB-dependent receptor family protein n=1 Tax=Roseococcus sp. SYP-B2431 TaxID=2496640 RepID=UPI0013F3AFB9|nr:TonB-dependent receptor [Roseococcus sp. SYP-B2431]
MIPWLATSALAQTELPEMQVAAPRPALTAPTDADARLRLWSSPGANTLVPAHDFLDRPGTTGLRDMLEYTAGVFAQPKWGEDTRLSIRGSGLARNFHLRGVRLLQDGIPVNQADGSGDFQELDPLTFQRVEVLRGGNAFTLGANTLGGAIDFVTPTGRDISGVNLRAEAGSFGFLRSQISGGGTYGPMDGWISGTIAQQDGYRDHSGGSSGRLNLNIGYRISDDAETRLYFTHNSIQQDIPGAVSRSQALNAPRTANATNLAMNYQRNIDSYRLGSRTAVRLNVDTLLEFGGSWVTRQLNHPIFQYIDNRTNDFNLFARGTWDGTVGGLRNRLVGGINYAYGTTDNRRFVNFQGNRGAQTFSASDRAQTADAYVENSLYVLPRLAVVTGVSGGQATRSSDNRLNAALGGSGRWNWVNPRAGLLWQATPEVQAYGNLTWSTEPPTLSDLVALVPFGGFSALKPQRATTLEIGTRGTAGRFTFELAAYHAWVDKEIQLFMGPTSGTSFARNADRTIHQGVELAGTFLAGRDLLAERDSLTLRGAYTFSDFRFDGDATYRDNQLPGAPRHVLRAEARYRHPSGFWIAPNLDYVPEGFFVDNANTTRTDSYALIGLRAGAELLDGRLGLFLEARNLADRRYISSASVAPVAAPNAALFEPGLGRSAYAGARLRF